MFAGLADELLVAREGFELAWLRDTPTLLLGSSTIGCNLTGAQPHLNMHEMSLLRRENLRILIESRGGLRPFLDDMGNSKNRLSELVGKTLERDFSDEVARQIEQIAGLPLGSLDVAPGESAESMGSDERQIADFLCQNIKTLMEQRGFNQSELARRSNLALSTVNRVFHLLDNGVSPRLETIAGIARGLGVQAADLLMTRPPVTVEAPHIVPHDLARQLSRLVEDFVLCDSEARASILSFASGAASDESKAKRRRKA